jgi:hypothetical protein
MFCCDVRCFLQVMEQETSSRQTLEAEIGALKDALRLAQQGQPPIMETCEHIHAVSIGLMSPWEVSINPSPT